MGGEKLYEIRKIFLTALIAVGIIVFTYPIFSQEAQGLISEEALIHLDAPAVNPEESIILGEAVPGENLDSGSSSLWIVFRMVLILALAALAIYGVVFFIKRLARPPQARDPHLKVLATVPLGADTYAAVISIGAKAWLVGGGSGAGVSLISELQDSESIETMLLDEANKAAESRANRFPDFRTLLDRFSSRPKPLANESLDADTIAGADAIRRHRERLEQGR